MARAEWVRSDGTGRDAATLRRRAGGWIVDGRAQFRLGQAPVDLRYKVLCDDGFATQRAEVRGRIGARRVSRTLVHRDGTWWLGGRRQPALQACADVDLAFTPATNTLPIRRLRLGVGQSAEASAAWMRLPGLDVRRLDQRYTRRSTRGYAYASGRFRADLTVGASGLVERYGAQWARVKARTSRRSATTPAS